MSNVPRRAVSAMIGLPAALVALLVGGTTGAASAPGAGALRAQDGRPLHRLVPAAQLSSGRSQQLHMFATGSAAGPRARPAQGGTPVSTGSCILIRPQIFPIYDRERARRGLAPFTYHGLTGARCSPSVASVYCYGEIWRRRDFKVIGNLGVFGKNRRCVASVIPRPPVYYKQRTKHWTKAAIVMKAPPAAFWGSGRGPAGWSCSGQGTRELSCVSSSAQKQ